MDFEDEKHTLVGGKYPKALTHELSAPGFTLEVLRLFPKFNENLAEKLQAFKIDNRNHVMSIVSQLDKCLKFTAFQGVILYSVR